MKYSKQREMIYENVMNSCNHPTAEMVYSKIKEKMPKISLGTVYRNLNILASEGLIKKIIIPDNSDRFDKTLDDHYHMYCQNCYNVVDISLDELNNINNIVSKKTGYKILSNNIIFYGLCHNCKRED